ncbi:MAG TPA: hypothetical protein VMM92_03250, partial [Thermoanaerobaculia bacterium]|nr:hypothetical protein [Thermoanaerobaculia bacterium]
GGGRLRQALLEVQKRRIEYAPFLLLCVAMLAFCLAMPLLRVGDAADYILATESLRYDGDLLYTHEDLVRHLALKPADFDSPAGLHTAVGRDGRVYLGAHHSFYYSAAALPFYVLFGYRGFLLCNGLFYLLFALCLYWHLRRANPPWAAWIWLLLALLFSASWTYVGWIHTEVFYMALLGFFMYLWKSGRPVWAALPLGLAAAAQPILGIVALGFLLYSAGRHRKVQELSGIALVFALAAAPQVLFNLYAFGHLHPFLGTASVSWHYVSLARFVRAWLDPAAGVLWFYPAVVVALLEIPRTWRSAMVVAWALAVVLASGVSVAWFSHQVGLRYGSYVFPLLLFLVERVDLLRPRALAGWSFVVFAGTSLAINPIGNSAMSPRDKTFLPFQLARELPGYRENRDVRWSRLHILGASTGLSAIGEDGWIPGAEPVEVWIAQRPFGPLELTVEPWPQALGRPQRLVIRTLTRSFEARLAPGAPRKIVLPLKREDFQDDLSVAHGTLPLVLEAEGWSPLALDPAAGDSRRLGVQLLTVRQAGALLFQR